MINAVHISKRFGTVDAIDDVSLHIKKGERVCIIGPSGSGKSTLIRCLHGLEIPDEGECIINGERINFAEKKERTLSHVGFVFQLFNLFPHMTVLKNLTLGPVKAFHVKKEQAQANARKLSVVPDVNCKHYRHRTTCEYRTEDSKHSVTIHIAPLRYLVLNPRHSDIGSGKSGVEKQNQRTRILCPFLDSE